MAHRPALIKRQVLSASIAGADPALKRSPFHALHEAHYPGVEWEEWAGFNTATAMGDIDEELAEVRTGTVAFDMSPVVKYRIKGADAEAFLNLLTTRQMAIETGRVRYTCWCNEAGKIIDDGTCFRLAADEYLLLPGDRHPEHFAAVAAGLDVAVTDVTAELAALTVQGKTSLSALLAFGAAGLEELRPFRFADFETAAGVMRISRTGFFGDLGYELWMRPDQAPAAWASLLAAGARPVGMSCLERARLEAGLLIPGEGFDFVPAVGPPERFNRSPFEVGLGFLVSTKKLAFVGREALLAEKERGSEWALVALELAGTVGSEHGDKLRDAAGAEVGFVTSGLCSASIGRNIALASVKAGRGLEELGTAFTVELAAKGGSVAATAVDKLFVNPTRKLQNPAPKL
jgi:aminomethyltransferase